MWSFDSCQNPEEKLEECGDQLCRGESCDVPVEGGCLEPPEGRCDGDVVRLCHGGRPLAIDCAAKQLRCGYGAEGAECLPRVAASESCAGPARCEGETLVRCQDHGVVRTECGRAGARCLRLPGARGPSCVEIRPEIGDGDCGPCGCPLDQKRAEQLCDGKDEDRDQRVDEGLACGPVAVIAFVVADASGASSHAREDVEQELQRVNQAFSGHDEPTLQFVLEELIPLRAPQLLALDHGEFSALVDDPRIVAARETFYVPVLFTDEVFAGGETPKPGASTLPNGTCGGVQQSQGPELGLIALAKARYPTTLAHELGHFLGLCHTHDQLTPHTPTRAFRRADDAPLASCAPLCREEGDGICDTPLDPGPEVCSYDLSCEVRCASAGSPDPLNLMSYYAHCRAHFTAEQRALMEHTLALRRGWQRCRQGACVCALGGDDCPQAMSCRPVSLGSEQRATRCTLDGPLPARASCRAASDCGPAALCLRNAEGQDARCVRSCRASSAGCRCIEAGPELSVCREDLGP